MKQIRKMIAMICALTLAVCCVFCSVSASGEELRSVKPGETAEGTINEDTETVVRISIPAAGTARLKASGDGLHAEIRKGGSTITSATADNGELQLSWKAEETDYLIVLTMPAGTSGAYSLQAAFEADKAETEQPEEKKEEVKEEASEEEKTEEKEESEEEKPEEEKPEEEKTEETENEAPAGDPEQEDTESIDGETEETEGETTGEETTEEGTTEDGIPGADEEQDPDGHTEAEIPGDTEEGSTETGTTGETDEESTEAGATGEAEEGSTETGTTGEAEEESTEAGTTGETEEESAEAGEEAAEGTPPEAPAAEPEETAESDENENTDETEEPGEANGGVEVVIARTMKTGDAWSGIVKRKTPTVLKLEVEEAQTIHVLVAGKNIRASVQKSDRLTDDATAETTDPETNRVVISWNALPGSYLVSIGPDEGSLMAKARVTVMDDETFETWEAGNLPQAEELPAETEDESVPEETADEEAAGEVTIDEETTDEEVTDEEAADEETEPEPEPERTITVSVAWDTPNPMIGDTAHFTANLEGYEGLTYTMQWQNSPDRETWTDLPGETNETMDVVVTKENNQVYWRIVVYVEEDQGT